MTTSADTPQRRVLIVGASVAGPALAFWLHRGGHQVTIVEKAPATRRRGHAIDVRGTAVDVTRRMGILPALLARATDMRGMSMFDHNGRRLFHTMAGTLSGGRKNSGDIEIMREDLCTVLYEATNAFTDYMFDKSIDAINQQGDDVCARFSDGTTRRFDLVFGADGLHSMVRQLVFEQEPATITHLGQYLAVFTVPNFLRLNRWQVWMRPFAGRHGGMMSGTRNADARVYLGFDAPPLTFDRHDTVMQKRIVAGQFSDIGWVVPQVLTYMTHATDFHLDAVSQVRMATWWHNRVALVGDAAYASSPLSGQGTSLALVGAYILADALSRANGDHAMAFAAYETRMRPWVAQNQELALINIERARATAEGRHPSTVPGIDTDDIKNAIQLTM